MSESETPAPAAKPPTAKQRCNALEQQVEALTMRVARLALRQDEVETNKADALAVAMIYNEHSMQTAERLAQLDIKAQAAVDGFSDLHNEVRGQSAMVDTQVTVEAGDEVARPSDQG